MPEPLQTPVPSNEGEGTQPQAIPAPAATPYVTPVKTEPQPEPQPQPGTQKDESTALTEQRVLEIAEQVAKKVAGELSDLTVRKVQSLTDKAENRIKGELKSRVEAIKALGLDLTPEQELQLEGLTRQQVRNQLASDDADVSGQQQSPASPAVVEKVREKASILEVQYGTRIMENDPETVSVSWNDPDPLNFLKTFESALKAKANRVSNQQSAGSTPTKSGDQLGSSADANVVQTQNKPTGLDPNLSPQQLFDMAYSKTKKE